MLEPLVSLEIAKIITAKEGIMKSMNQTNAIYSGELIIQVIFYSS